MSVIARRSALPFPAPSVSPLVRDTKHDSPWRKMLRRAAGVLGALRRRREVMTLLDMDDRMLRDIGLMRTDVTSALAGSRVADPSPHLVALAHERRVAERGPCVRLAAGTPVEPAARPARRFASGTAMDLGNTA